MNRQVPLVNLATNRSEVFELSQVQGKRLGINETTEALITDSFSNERGTIGIISLGSQEPGLRIRFKAKENLDLVTKEREMVPEPLPPRYLNANSCLDVHTR